MAPKSVTFRRHDHLVSVLLGDLLSHSYNITFSMFLDLVTVVFADFACIDSDHHHRELGPHQSSCLVLVQWMKGQPRTVNHHVYLLNAMYSSCT